VETQFSEEALKDELINLKDESVSLESILEQHKGNTIFIDVWASWCKDCLKGLPGVKMLQQTHPEIDFIYLSLDKSKLAWKKSIDRLEIQGSHFFVQSGWKGAVDILLLIKME
jgi:thiol-disulfide isomerase/thioredoxin